MKNQIKLTITFGITLTCLLFSCKNQDGYSDEIYTNPNPHSENSTAKTVSDSAGVTNGGVGSNTQPTGAQSTGYQSANSGDVNAGSARSGSITGAQSATSGEKETKGTGVENGPGNSAKDGAVYTPHSDPRQRANKDTIQKKSSKK